MYRVEIQVGGDNGAYCTDDELPLAVLEAVRGSRTYTLAAFAIGVIANIVTEEVFHGGDQERLEAFLRHVYHPDNVRESVELAIGETGGEVK